jgi:uncharacterized membrane protein
MDEYGTHLEKMKTKAIDNRRGGVILVVAGLIIGIIGTFALGTLGIIIGLAAIIIGAVRVGVYKRREDDITAQILKHGTQETA